MLIYTGYEWTRAWFEKAALRAGRASKKLTTVESMMAGALAGSATVLLTNPIWVVNTRMTTRKSESNEQVLPGSKPAKAPSTLGTLLALLRDEGPARLFAGVMPALVLVINPILQYTVFEQMKQFLEKKRRVTPKDAFYLGALGKLLATSITYPYITVKSRMHVAGRDGPREDMLTTFRRIVREEGYTGLYGGVYSKKWIIRLRANSCRYWSQGHSECHHRCLPFRVQGRSVLIYRCRPQEDRKQVKNLGARRQGDCTMQTMKDEGRKAKEEEIVDVATIFSTKGTTGNRCIEDLRLYIPVITCLIFARVRSALPIHFLCTYAALFP
jgi:hypothetical protein